MAGAGFCVGVVSGGVLGVVGCVQAPDGGFRCPGFEVYLGGGVVTDEEELLQLYIDAPPLRRVPGQELSCRVGLSRSTGGGFRLVWGLFQYEMHQKTAKPAQILEEGFRLGWLCTCWCEQGCYLGCSLVCGCMRWWGCFYA